jgi:hypothetical protein
LSHIGHRQAISEPLTTLGQASGRASHHPSRRLL